MRYLLIFLFSLAFACNTKNFNTAYQDFYKNQQIYIRAILNNNKKEEIKALKELIQCGEYLHFNVNEYKKRLNDLLPPKQTKHKCKYINILSFKPLEIKNITSYKIFSIKTKKTYKKVIDLKYAITPKPYISKIINKNLKLKIAQFKKDIVRIVYYSNKPIKLKIKKIDNKLIISLHTQYKNILNKPQKNYKKLFKRKKIIVIDPGHGGKDSGGIGIGRKEEKIAVLRIAKYLKYYLQKDGFIVYLTRNRDIFRPLKWRTHFANEKHADLFISIHCNISPHHIKYPHGIETYFLSPTNSARAIQVARVENKEIKGLNYLDQRVILGFLNRDRIIASNKLAIDVQAGMLSDLRARFKNVKDGGVRPAPFWVLVGTQMPAILIETGYLTNPLEAKRLFNHQYEKILAKGIAKGIINYFKKNP